MTAYISIFSKLVVELPKQAYKQKRITESEYIFEKDLK